MQYAKKTNEEYLSPRFKLQLGYKDDEMENKPEAWQAICDKEDVDRAYGTVTKYLSGESDHFSEVLRFDHKDGHKIEFLYEGIILHWSSNT